MSKEIEGHVFNDVCLKCGMSRMEYDDSRKPNPCRGTGRIKVPDDEPGTRAAHPRADRRPRRLANPAQWLSAYPKQVAIALLGAVIVQFAIADECPRTECNYLDPQYQTTFAQYSACMNGVTENFEKYMRFLAISYPRFGIAWTAYGDEIKAAVHADGTTDDAAIQAAKQRFDDRILRNAEQEAVNWYNMYITKMRQNQQPCGPMPRPPRGRPAP
jgi:hypothetical protein